MAKEDDEILKQLIDSLEKSADKLETAYAKNDIESFTRIKKLMLEINKKISIGAG